MEDQNRYPKRKTIRQRAIAKTGQNANQPLTAFLSNDRTTTVNIKPVSYARSINILVIVMLCLTSIASSTIGCDKNHPATVDNNNISDSTGNKMKITIGSAVFTATLYSDPTAAAFKALLPLTITMDDLNSNEKKYDFPDNLPTSLFNPGSVNNGDLMIWSGNTLVLFYKSFSTPYSYTRLGRIQDASGLAAAVGAGSVTVKFEQ